MHVIMAKDSQVKISFGSLNRKKRRKNRRNRKMPVLTEVGKAAVNRPVDFQTVSPHPLVRKEIRLQRSMQRPLNHRVKKVKTFP